MIIIWLDNGIWSIYMKFYLDFVFQMIDDYQNLTIFVNSHRMWFTNLMKLVTVWFDTEKIEVESENVM